LAAAGAGFGRYLQSLRRPAKISSFKDRFSAARLCQFPSNIAEGSERGSGKDFRAFFEYRHRLLRRLRTQLYIARKLTSHQPTFDTLIKNRKNCLPCWKVCASMPHAVRPRNIPLKINPKTNGVNHHHRPSETRARIQGPPTFSLADWGRKEIDIAEKEMPGLMAIREKYAPGKPAGRRSRDGSLHMNDSDGGAH